MTGWLAVLRDIRAVLWGYTSQRDSYRYVWSPGDVWAFQDEEWFSGTQAGT